MPTYAFIIAFSCTFLKMLPGRACITVTLVTFGLTAMIPVIAIYLLHIARIIKDPLLNNRHDRLFPYIRSMLCYLATSLYLHFVHAPSWMMAFMIGGASLLAIIMLINIRWKISGHAAGMGALTALSVFLVYKGYSIIPGPWLPSIIILLSGIVGTARMVLGRHTLTQVAAGYSLSILVLYITLIVSGTL